MKLRKCFLKRVVFYSFLLTLCACQNEWEGQEEVGFRMAFDQANTDKDQKSVLSSLSYTVCLFRAEIKSDGKELEHVNYLCRDMQPGLSETQANAYSFMITNTDLGKYRYRLFVLAASKGDGGLETSLTPLKQNVSTFEDIEVVLTEKGNGTYVPLSRNNYFAWQELTEGDMKEGVTQLDLKLQRFVGQLVFDVFKSDESGPQDIAEGFGSTLDLVKSIDVQVSGMTTKVKPYVETVVKSTESTASLLIETKLDADYKLQIADQDSLITSVVKKDVAVTHPRGGARVFSVYLLPTGSTGGELLKSKLTFTYHDTPIPAVGERLNEVVLRLPTVKSSLTIAKNCYTVTNIRLKNNRIVDLNTSGEVDIDTGWDTYDTP